MKFYKAEYFIAVGTGAPEHRYSSARAVAFSKSPKKAVRQAARAANRKLRFDGCVVLRELKLYYGSKLIHEAR